MRRLSIRKQSPSVTLFPFLAVLICTMGSLIVLLVLVVKQADVHAKEKNDREVAEIVEQQEELELALEHEEFRQDVLRQLRPEVTQQLADRRKELGYLEQNVRDLREQAERIERQLARLEETENARAVDLQSERDKLEIIRKEIAKAQEALDEARKKAESKPRSFAIIPYDGGQGTRRRPIYIECTKNGIIIQPEGIVIGPEDLKPPLVPGNPLDAALLATREYLDRMHGERAGNPYPLLIIRPDGTDAYQFARAAMRSWDDEFGYELISEDLKLAFPPADPNLDRLLRQTISDARQRQAALAAAQPMRFRSGAGGGSGSGGGAYGLRASPNGGFVLESLDGQGSVSRGSTRDDGSFRKQILGAAGGDGSGRSGSEGDGWGEGFADGGDSFNRSGQRPARSFGGQNTGNGQPHGDTSQHANTGSASRNGFTHAGRQGDLPAESSVRHENSQQGEFASAANGYASANARPGQQPTNPAGRASSSQPSFGPASGQSGFGQPNSQSPGNAGPSSNAGSFGGASSGVPGNALPESLAGSRGADWALPQKAPGAVAIRRPIRMLCFADHLVITTGRFSNQNATIVNFDGPTSASVGDLTSRVWTHMEGWGIAGRNAYWKPEIKIEVSPGGEQRFRELDALMQNSGFEIRRVAP